MIPVSQPHANWREKQLAEARRRFAQSEWVLNLLRSQGSAPLSKLSDNQLLEWNQQLSQLTPR